jgi:hypothetical protein
MPFCPTCRYEYVEGIKTCPDCYVELVPELEEEKKEAARLFRVATFTYPLDAEMAKLRLEAEGIQCALSNEVLTQTSTPSLNLYPVEVLVRGEDAERAVEIIKEIREK